METPEARNRLRHAVSLTLSKIADGLIDPKLVLAWLASALGAPASFMGLLVPIREAGSLLPQMLIAPLVEKMRFRKWVWAGACLGQGLAAVLIVVVGLTLSGVAAGVALCLVLAGLALSRSAASVSYKDILGKTVAKTRRGTVTGFAGSAAAFAVLVFALLMIFGAGQTTGFILGAIGLAAFLWGLAGFVFSRLEEDPSEPGPHASVSFAPLCDDPQLRLFIVVRGLLVPTALAPPYLVAMAGAAGQSALSSLGALVLASSAASFCASFVWGRLSDRSSRRVLMIAGVLGAAAMTASVFLDKSGFAATGWAMPGALFGLMIAYHGVRQGRSIYLVDMAPEDRRATYAALANTVIGLLLLVVGAAGGAAALFGPAAALTMFAILCLAASVLALGLNEVER